MGRKGYDIGVILHRKKDVPSAVDSQYVEAGKSTACSLDQQAEDPGQPVVQMHFIDRLPHASLVFSSRRQIFSLLFCSGPQLTPGDPPTLWKTICLIQSPLI